MKDAVELAREEASTGRDVLILVPSYHYFKSLSPVEQGYSLTHPCTGIFIRSAQNEPSLQALRVDTLIIVGDCNSRGERLARQAVLGSTEPRIIERY